MTRCTGLGACAVVATLLVGCGSTGATTTVTERQTTTVIREVVPEETRAPRAEREAPADDAASPVAADDSAAAGDITLPDVVGKDHQLAQDTMQSAGLYNLSEEDATGQDRLLLLDRNWVVVEQDPQAGSRVSEDATIVLRSKKIGE